jgi:hypothetical protein
MYVKDNRPEGELGVRITVRNEPPTDGGKASRNFRCISFRGIIE